MISESALVDAFSDADLVELEIFRLVFLHVGQVEGDADDIALHGIVLLVAVIVYDVCFAVVERG